MRAKEESAHCWNTFLPNAGLYQSFPFHKRTIDSHHWYFRLFTCQIRKAISRESHKSGKLIHIHENFLIVIMCSEQVLAICFAWKELNHESVSSKSLTWPLLHIIKQMSQLPILYYLQEPVWKPVIGWCVWLQTTSTKNTRAISNTSRAANNEIRRV